MYKFIFYLHSTNYPSANYDTKSEFDIVDMESSVQSNARESTFRR